MTIPQRFTNGDATFYVLVVSDDMGTADDEGGDAIIWEHPFPEGTELRDVLKRQALLDGRYGTSWVAECQIIPETKRGPATAEECSADRKRYIPGPQQVAECGGPCEREGPEACDCQDAGSLVEALIAAGIARTPLEARQAVSICAGHIANSRGMSGLFGARVLREEAGLA